MPFFVAWTDELTEDSFLAFHRAAWESWRPEKWTLNFVTFLEIEGLERCLPFFGVTEGTLRDASDS
jgi:hypothetical protein